MWGIFLVTHVEMVFLKLYVTEDFISRFAFLRCCYWQFFILPSPNATILGHFLNKISYF